MNRNFNSILLLSTMLFSVVSCTSTEIVEPDSPNRGNLVTLTVAAPEAYNFGSSTRADDQHQLRLVARLYSVDNPTVPLQNKETIANSAATNVQFSIENTGIYFVTIFADYIDKVSPDDKGHYPDKYYNTTESGKVTTITDNPNLHFFNNDNRDCFAGKIVFEKGLNVVEKNLTLKRPVCKILVSAPNNNVASIVESLEITECSHFDSYSFTLDNSTNTGTLSEESSAPKSLTPANENAIINSPTDNLFFFYTFGGEASVENRPALGAISFSLTPLDGIELNRDDNDQSDNTAATRTIASALIKPAPNYLITVKGGNNWISAKPGGDDITIIFNGLEDWNNPTDINL